MCSGTMGIEFNHKRKCIILFGTQITFNMICAGKIIKSQIDLKLKARSEFPMGRIQNHSNPYIQGTTVPCDIHDCTCIYEWYVPNHDHKPSQCIVSRQFPLV